MTEDELRQRFDLTRQAIGTWSAVVVDIARAAAASAWASPDAQAIEAAERTRAAIKEEQRSLEEACRSSAFMSDELETGFAKAMTELYTLDREISAALSRMRRGETR